MDGRRENPTEALVRNLPKLALPLVRTRLGTWSLRDLKLVIAEDVLARDTDMALILQAMT